jgi:hypothetical protein
MAAATGKSFADAKAEVLADLERLPVEDQLDMMRKQNALNAAREMDESSMQTALKLTITRESTMGDEARKDVATRIQKKMAPVGGRRRKSRKGRGRRATRRRRA